MGRSSDYEIALAALRNAVSPAEKKAARNRANQAGLSELMKLEQGIDRQAYALRLEHDITQAHG